MNIIHKVTTARIDISTDEARTLATALELLLAVADATHAGTKPYLSPEQIVASWLTGGGSATTTAVLGMKALFHDLARP